jgi:uncharacterized protein (DUF488 family)
MVSTREKVIPPRKGTPGSAKALWTIGYEGRVQSELVTALRKGAVSLLLDVRSRASSRKSGFSKTSLAAACAAAGIAYQHDRELGTPPALLEHALGGAGYDNETTEAYRAHLLSQGCNALEKAIQLATATTTCLLCYERDPTNCHRKVVAEEIAKRTGLEVSHL